MGRLPDGKRFDAGAPKFRVHCLKILSTNMGIAHLAAYFFDSSALAKRYHPEQGTSKVDRIVQEASSVIRISKADRG